MGGWLTLERYIAPYSFAITDCHIRGDLCWYPGQLSAPSRHAPNYQLCDLYQCLPYRTPSVFASSNSDNNLDYPLDEYTLSVAFGNSTVGRQAAEDWFNAHFEHFLTFEDLEYAAQRGVTHVRVPLPHWILGDVQSDEPWIVGDRWKYFLRMLDWCRTLQLQVWPDIHTAPGSQNGFDNSGQQLESGVSCQGWSGNVTHVQRSLRVIQEVTTQIVKEGYQDVVTGFGLLNEPFKDCHRDVYLQFIDQGLTMVRETLGINTTVYVSDLFLAKTFNNGKWSWLGKEPRFPSLSSSSSARTTTTYQNTYLDSHYYHVFAEQPRALSPRQHIAYVCQNEYRDTIACCYQDGPTRNTIPAPGIQRMVGEWSAAFDTLPVAKLKQLMDGIATHGEAPEFNRQLSSSRQDFLLKFVQAQMVSYEASSVGTSGAWFYWTLKMEGGAFAEWDFLRGLREGWIPTIPLPNETSQSLYGTCYDLIFQTSDSMEVVHEFPDPSTLPANNWQGVDIDDDVVVTHGQSLLVPARPTGPIQPVHHTMQLWVLVGLVLTVAVGATVRYVWRHHRNTRNRKSDYSSIPDDEDDTGNNHSSTNGHLSISV